MSEDVNRYREQWNNHIDDHFGSVMPITIFRVTWKDPEGDYCEYWTESIEQAHQKKWDIDHSDGKLAYINFESWLSYRSDEHDRRFGRIPRERGWWE